jgi:hypothetical protein
VSRDLVKEPKNGGLFSWRSRKTGVWRISLEEKGKEKKKAMDFTPYGWSTGKEVPWLVTRGKNASSCSGRIVRVPLPR